MLFSLSVRLRDVAFLFLALIVIVSSCQQAPPKQEEPSYQPTFEMPDEPGEMPTDRAEAQAFIEELTWQKFISLNWPALTDLPEADPNAALPSSNSYQTVWNNWGLNFDLYFLPSGMEPLPLSDQEGLRAQRKERWKKDCPDILRQGDVVLGELVADEFIEAGLHAAPHYPIVDGNGEYVRTSVLYNPALYDFVQGNKLYDVDGAKAYLWSGAEQPFKTQKKGDILSSDYRVDVPDGSIMLKTSWKILGEGDDPAEFFTKDMVFVFENRNLAGAVATSCDPIKVGLVGFHMTIKTPNQQSWVWSTFEHVKNVPDLNDEAPEGDYNFWHKGGLASSEGINIPPKPTDTTPEFKENPYWFDPAQKGQLPSQAMRIIPIAPRTKALNRKYQEILKNTVWKNYALVGTQWEYAQNQFTPSVALQFYPGNF